MVLIIKQKGDARFGNNVIQLIQAIHVAETYNIQVVRFPFQGFHRNEIRLNGITNPNHKQHPFRKERIVDDFFYPHYYSKRFPELPAMTEQNSRRIALQYLKPIIKYAYNIPFEPDFENSLFVHIRSGDIFSNPTPNNWYTQPPYDYYKLIFSLETDKQIVVLYEDELNPVVKRLKENYPQAKFYSLTFLTTICIFLNAKHVVVGNGTFIPAVLCMNDSYITAYSPNVIPFLNNIWTTEHGKCRHVKLPNYITEWKNTEEQRKFMLTYTGAYI